MVQILGNTVLEVKRIHCLFNVCLFQVLVPLKADITPKPLLAFNDKVFLDEGEEDEPGEGQHSVALYKPRLTEALLELLLDHLGTVEDVYLGVGV